MRRQREDESGFGNIHDGLAGEARSPSSCTSARAVGCSQTSQLSSSTSEPTHVQVFPHLAMLCEEHVAKRHEPRLHLSIFSWSFIVFDTHQESAINGQPIILRMSFFQMVLPTFAFRTHLLLFNHQVLVVTWPVLVGVSLPKKQLACKEDLQIARSLHGTLFTEFSKFSTHDGHRVNVSVSLELVVVHKFNCCISGNASVDLQIVTWMCRWRVVWWIVCDMWLRFAPP